MGKAIRKSSIGTRLEKGSKLGMLCCELRNRAIRVCVCGRYQTGRKETKSGFNVEILMKEVDLGEPTLSKEYCRQLQDVFEPKISAGAMENYQFPRIRMRIYSSWSYNKEGHAKKCVERYCELANKTIQQLYKVATPCMVREQTCSCSYKMDQSM